MMRIRSFVNHKYMPPTAVNTFRAPLYRPPFFKLYNATYGFTVSRKGSALCIANFDLLKYPITDDVRKTG